MTQTTAPGYTVLRRTATVTHFTHPRLDGYTVRVSLAGLGFRVAVGFGRATSPVAEFYWRSEAVDYVATRFFSDNGFDRTIAGWDTADALVPDFPTPTTSPEGTE